MKITPEEPSSVGILRAMLRPDCGIVPRIASSLITGLLLSAAALVGAFAYGVFWSGVGYVRDEWLALAFAFAGVAWLLGLTWIWRGFARGAGALRAAILTAAVAVITITAGITIDGLLSRGEEYPIIAVTLLGDAVAVLIWTPVIMRLVRRRAVIRSGEDIVDVTCPRCGYLLVGLTELRCPECGEQFTIDSLIRAQRYDQPKIVRAAS